MPEKQELCSKCGVENYQTDMAQCHELGVVSYECVNDAQCAIVVKQQGIGRICGVSFEQLELVTKHITIDASSHTHHTVPGIYCQTIVNRGNVSVYVNGKYLISTISACNLLPSFELRLTKFELPHRVHMYKLAENFLRANLAVCINVPASYKLLRREDMSIITPPCFQIDVDMDMVDMARRYSRESVKLHKYLETICWWREKSRETINIDTDCRQIEEFTVNILTKQQRKTVNNNKITFEELSSRWRALLTTCNLEVTGYVVKG